MWNRVRMNRCLPTMLPAENPRSLRREFLGKTGTAILSAVASSTIFSGCVPVRQADRKPDLVWGRRGLSDGRLMKPRAMTIDSQDRLYIVDMTGRIQVFDTDGNFLRGWRTPEIKNGKPLGMTIGNDGCLVVADTHYFRVLFYSLNGELYESRTMGGESGEQPGQFNFVTDVVQRANGNFCVGQYGQIDPGTRQIKRM